MKCPFRKWCKHARIHIRCIPADPVYGLAVSAKFVEHWLEEGVNEAIEEELNNQKRISF